MEKSAAETKKMIKEERAKEKKRRHLIGLEMKRDKQKLKKLQYQDKIAKLEQEIDRLEQKIGKISE
jgi:hypothetical protein